MQKAVAQLWRLPARLGLAGNLVVELLRGCGMIRRSEKRSLLGVMALGRQTPLPDSYNQPALLNADSTIRVLDRVPSTNKSVRSPINRGTLVHPFWKCLRLNVRLGSFEVFLVSNASR